MTASIDRQLRAYSDFFESQLPAIDVDEVFTERVTTADAQGLSDGEALVAYLPPPEPPPARRRPNRGRAVTAIAAAALVVAGVMVVTDRDGRDVGTDTGNSPGVSDSAPNYEWSRVTLDTATSDEVSPWVYSVTVGGPGLVAVGAEDSGSLDRDAAVWTSVDGIAWSRVPHDETIFGGSGVQEMWDVTTGGPGLVAVGRATAGDGPDSFATAAVWTSTDGLNWTRVPHDPEVFGGAGDKSTDSFRMSAVTSGGPGLVAVGEQVGASDAEEITGVWDPVAAVWTSTDGLNWTRVPHDPEVFGDRDDNEPVHLHDVTSGGPGLVAVGDMGIPPAASRRRLWTSVDGLNWTRIQDQGAGLAVTAGGPGLVSVGGSSVWVSEDGLSWTRVPRDPAAFGEPGASGQGSSASGVELHGVTTTGSGLVAVGGTDEGAAVWTSVDGIEWSRVPHDEEVFGGQGSQYMLDVASTDAGLVAVGRTSQHPQYPSGEPTVWVATATERVGFIGLPPEGTMPSASDAGETVLEHLWGDGPITGYAGLESFPGAIWVYADGRVIWYVHADLPEGANARSTGFLEQRLTPDGVDYFVESFRSELRAMTPEELGERLRDPLGWPAGTWLDQTIRPYVATNYRVCFQPLYDRNVRSGNPDAFEANELEGPGGWSQLLELLPESARDIARAWNWGENRSHPNGFFIYCAHRSTEEARALADALSEAGVDQGALENLYELEYRLDDLLSGNPVHLVFFPSVPEGAEYFATG